METAESETENKAGLLSTTDILFTKLLRNIYVEGPSADGLARGHSPDLLPSWLPGHPSDAQ